MYDIVLGTYSPIPSRFSTSTRRTTLPNDGRAACNSLIISGPTTSSSTAFMTALPALAGPSHACKEEQYYSQATSSGAAGLDPPPYPDDIIEMLQSTVVVGKGVDPRHFTSGAVPASHDRDNRHNASSMHILGDYDISPRDIPLPPGEISLQPTSAYQSQSATPTSAVAESSLLDDLMVSHSIHTFLMSADEGNEKTPTDHDSQDDVNNYVQYGSLYNIWAGREDFPTLYGSDV